MTTCHSLAITGMILTCACGCGPRLPDKSPAPVQSQLVAHATHSLRLLSLEDQVVDPFQSNGVSPVVFIFVRPDCPISNGYTPEIQRLHERFGKKDAAFWLVYADPDVASRDIRSHLKEHQLTCDAVRDPGQELVRLCQARVTPEAAVFVSGRRLIYHGRIDDRFAAFGTERPTPTRHDLEEVLTALSAGRTLTPTSTPAIGCAIPVPR